MKEFDYSWDDQDPEQISDLVEGEYDSSLKSIENQDVGGDEWEDFDDSGLCSCGDDGKQKECEDCRHDLECRESHCDNKDHRRVVDFGYPESCNCYADKLAKICLGCGHTTACNSEQQELCFTEPHAGILVFSHYSEDCECQGSHFAYQCPDCQHNRECGSAKSLCREVAFHKAKDLSSTSEFVQSIAISDESNSVPNISILTRQGAYWTQQEDQHLIASYTSSESDKEIALSLGRTVAAIRARLVKVCFEANGVRVSSFGSDSERSGEGWTEEEDAQLRKFREDGSGLEEIGKSLERTELSIAYRLISLRLVTPGNLEKIQYRKPSA